MTSPDWFRPSDFPHGCLCGCDCACGRVLSEGNAMQMEAGKAGATPEPWEEDVRIPIMLLVCADCFVGSHPSPPSPEGT